MTKTNVKKIVKHNSKNILKQDSKNDYKTRRRITVKKQKTGGKI